MFDFTFEDLPGFLIAFIPGIINFSIVFYILSSLPKNRLTNIFALLTLALALWQLDDSMARITKTALGADSWDALLCPAWIFVGSLAIHFTLLYTNIIATYSRLRLALIYMPGFIFVALYQSHLYPHNFQYSGFWGWVNYHDEHIIDQLQLYWISVLVILSTFLMFRNTIKERHNKLLKYQSLFIAIGFAIPTISGIITQVIFPIFLDLQSIPVSSTVMTFFSVATLIALKRYKLFKVSDLISNEALIDSLPFIVFSVSDNRRLTFMNAFGKELLGIHALPKGHSEFDQLIRFKNDYEKEAFYKAFNNALNGQPGNIETSLSCWSGTIDVLLFLNPIINNNRIQGVLFAARDITELKSSAEKLKELNKSLLEKNRELEVSNEELTSFNYIASHDLKEPLRKIQMFSDRILDSDNDGVSLETKSYLTRIFSASQYMQKLIESLLEYSRTTGSETAFELVDINEILTNSRNELSENISSSGARIIIGDMPVMKVIPFQFQQLFTNLISNSIKYKKEDRPPTIRISSDRVTMPGQYTTDHNSINFWKITVEDNGIGFESHYAERIFDLFKRLHDKNEYSGTGIGLAICKKIVQNHHGIIKAYSSPGQGTRFEIFIPV